MDKKDINTFRSSCAEFKKMLEDGEKRVDELADKLAGTYRLHAYKNDLQALTTSLESILRELQQIHFSFGDNYDDVHLKYNKLDKQFGDIIAACSKGIQKQRDDLRVLPPDNYARKDVIILRTMDYYNAAIEAASIMRKIESTAGNILMEFSGVLGRISVISTVIGKFYNTEDTSKLEEEIEFLQKVKEESIRRYIW